MYTSAYFIISVGQPVMSNVGGVMWPSFIKESVGGNEDGESTQTVTVEDVLDIFTGAQVSLKDVCATLELAHPDRITSVSLRKYMATMTQVCGMNGQFKFVCTLSDPESNYAPQINHGIHGI